MIREEAAALFAEVGDSIDFKVGTMIEIPRAALTADRIASSAEFFSFGTNDLTQMTFGYSRDDIASFLPVYLEKKILKVDRTVWDSWCVWLLKKVGLSVRI